MNQELLPTSGIRAGLSAITPAAFLSIVILLASPFHCQNAPSVCQWHEKSSLCMHVIPNPNPELFFCCIFMREFRICLKPYFLWALFWWAATCYTGLRSRPSRSSRICASTFLAYAPPPLCLSRNFLMLRRAEGASSKRNRI